MNPAFWIIQFFVVVFSILITGALLRPFWNYFRRETPSRELIEVSDVTSYTVLFAAFALSWYCTGVSWLTQFVIDPLYVIMASAGRQAFSAFAFGVQEKFVTAGFVPATIVFACSGLLLWIRPPAFSLRIAWISAAICATILIIIFIPARAQLQLLQRGYSEAIYNRLVIMRGFCTVLFTMHSLLLLFACIRMKVAKP